MRIPSIKIPHPQLWWPNGYGSQPLYEIEITLKDGKTVLDQRSYRIGLRTIELRQEPDPWEKNSRFYVNGIRLFAKGADWIPADLLPTRITESHLKRLIKSAADANMNMLRVWVAAAITPKTRSTIFVTVTAFCFGRISCSPAAFTRQTLTSSRTCACSKATTCRPGGNR